MELVETCALTNTPIQYGDSVVRVRLTRRTITPANERDFFQNFEHFQDVIDVVEGEYDGDGTILIDAADTTLPNARTLFFHKQAWDLAQTYNSGMTEESYDPPAKSRELVLRLHKEAEERLGKKVKMDSAFKPREFPKGTLEFARVVMLAWQTRRNIVPPPAGPDNATDYMDASMQLLGVAVQLWGRVPETAEWIEETLTFDVGVGR